MKQKIKKTEINKKYTKKPSKLTDQIHLSVVFDVNVFFDLC